MIYDVERLEAGLQTAWEEWRSAVEAHYTPYTDMKARQAGERQAFDRLLNFQQALQGVRSGFYHISEERKHELFKFLEAYKLEGSA